VSCTHLGSNTFLLLSDERTGLSFTTAAGSRQRSHSQVSDSRLPQLGGQHPRIYVPLEQGGSAISPGTEFPFRRPLQLAGLRWWYSNLPPSGARLVKHFPSFYTTRSSLVGAKATRKQGQPPLSIERARSMFTAAMRMRLTYITLSVNLLEILEQPCSVLL
jgi:hypothetical protein